MVKPSLAVLLAALALAGAISAHAQPPTSGAASAAPGDWKEIFANSQTTYYLESADAASHAQVNLRTLTEFTVPQVIDGVQVRSIVSSMRLDCGGKRMVTIDDGLYADRMGGGKLIALQAANDTWHPPAPGSLGELIWNSACKRK